MAKRKRNTEEISSQVPVKKHLSSMKSQSTSTSILAAKRAASKNVQIITGSYDRVLHGIIATLPESESQNDESRNEARFQDNFLFNAHNSAIRCLAVSPLSSSKSATEAQKLILASGGTDERINLYHISASVPPALSKYGPLPATLGTKAILENPKNKELGALLHHSSNINVLHFPTRSKLLSGSEDNTIAISRTRDWTVLSTIKAPVPKVEGQASGDTTALGGTVCGVNDFSVHPSSKLMISVGKGEKCMRLWNLVTGKKAGVLSFDRSLLVAAGEGRWSKGEGKKVLWNDAGDEFVVGFEKGAVVFAMDSKPKGRIVSSPVSRIHQIRYCSRGEDASEVVVISTEDGRLVFFSENLQSPSADEVSEIPSYEVIGHLGGKACGIEARVIDFEILSQTENNGTPGYLIITAGSDGSVRLWKLDEAELKGNGPSQVSSAVSETNFPREKTPQDGTKSSVRQLGRLIGTYSTPNRITCLKAFMLLDAPEDAQKNKDGLEDEFDGLD